MIKYETILSNFDDKVTLYNWLRKVEEALKNASATNFVVNKKGNATLSFSITFADGETLESGDIVLQQGESVDDARIAGGVLQLHLTNGTWLTAGNLGAVSNFSIDANQHLIVNYQDGTSQDLGAIFNGNINIAGNLTADSIIENMTGYTFSLNDVDEKISVAYAGVVKTGNKITFVVSGTLNAESDIALSTSISMGRFVVPTSVGQKIYPNFDTRRIGPRRLLLGKAYNEGIDIMSFVTKWTDTLLQPYMSASQIIPQGTYHFRYEETYLLSDNLAQ